MNIMRKTPRFLMLLIMSVAAPSAFGARSEITAVDAVAEGDTVRIDIQSTTPVQPIVRVAGHPTRLMLVFQNVMLGSKPRAINVNHAGVGEVRTAVHQAAPAGATIVVTLDAARPFGIDTNGNTLVLRILPHPAPARVIVPNPLSDTHVTFRETSSPAAAEVKNRIQAFVSEPPPEVEHLPVASEIDEPPADCPATIRPRFRIKFVAGSTAYIDGGSNAGLRMGMNFDIRNASANPVADQSEQAPIGAARVIGIATTSAILEVGTSSGDFKAGDWADLLPRDADDARRNVVSSPANTLQTAGKPVDEDSDGDVHSQGQSFRSRQELDQDAGPRNAGRMGLDYSGISSTGSTPGTSFQVGMLMQSDIRNFLGTHWNLEGYWRGRINRHSQFQEPTIEDTLNKTYTMELYYDNPDSRWVAGVGRLYLPWAVSLDTVDGGYLGRKFPLRNTTGVFAGSTPDLSSWHYRPNQRIGGVFTNFEGGDYDRFHYSSTTGVALTSIKWKLDRPFAFFENEASYKGQFSAFHSLTFDSPLGPSTNGIRPGAGVSHSYFTFHYQPKPVVSIDLYHNFFRDVPTAVTSIVGTGLGGQVAVSRNQRGNASKAKPRLHAVHHPGNEQKDGGCTPHAG